MFLPDGVVPGGVDDRLLDHPQAVGHLGGGAARLAVELEGEPGTVSDQHVENLVDEGVVECVDPGVFEQQLGVDHQGEDFTDRHQEVDVVGLAVSGCRFLEHLLEHRGLCLEALHVREVPGREGRFVVMELDVSQSARRALGEQEVIVGRVVTPRNLREIGGVEEIVRHELDDQGDVDVDRPLELWERADVAGRHLEVRVRLEPLGRDDVPQVVDDVFSLCRDLHLDDGVVEQVAAVVG